ncbi:protein SUPPRESSOR OF GENE SILENCING 3 [Cinnamomum micranthum f. kanehirae]|uniref:Protein SUPPRESSOR OF GENE SILENCING 3 n=1 Tax=Cinnamomum micranthum f. kanehirae TaxID=337451 RepID=A0A443NUI5_9MAGN|nr:protein SUPPRESSOR OF GENE SILENCING 3 [Cinnamomum micranthum f. kanehirae]
MENRAGNNDVLPVVPLQNLGSAKSGADEKSNIYLLKVDVKTGEKKRIYYGYLGSTFDLDKVDFDTRKRAQI